MATIAPSPTATTIAAAPAGPPLEPRARRTHSVTGRLLLTELRLLTRDPFVLVFVLVFPVVSMLIIGGSFGTSAGGAFPVDPTHWYVASYFATVIGSTGLLMMPVHIATYRERGVLRRFTASGFPRWSFAVAEFVLGLVAIVVSGAVLLAVAAPVYGVPAIHDVARVGAGVAVAAVAFVALGVLLGTVLPSARAAQSIGLTLFFPSFLLGVGGPPPGVMPAVLRHVADVLPLKLATDAIREPWLGIGHATGALVAVAVLAVVAGGLAVRRTAL